MIIGVCGYKGTGKDTVGNYLVENYGFTKLAFADKLKESVAALFGIDRAWVDEWKDDDGGTLPRVEVIVDIAARRAEHTKGHAAGNHQYTMSWREFLQRYGTESHRDVFGSDFWVKVLEEGLRYDPVKSPHMDYVITDVRFDNEAAWIRAKMGQVIRVTRTGYEGDGHVSEQPPLPNYVVHNIKDFEYLYWQIDNFMRILKYEPERVSESS